MRLPRSWRRWGGRGTRTARAPGLGFSQVEISLALVVALPRAPLQMHDQPEWRCSGLELATVDGAYLAAAEAALLGELRLEPLVMGLSDAYELCRWGLLLAPSSSQPAWASCRGAPHSMPNPLPSNCVPDPASPPLPAGCLRPTRRRWRGMPPPGCRPTSSSASPAVSGCRAAEGAEQQRGKSGDREEQQSVATGARGLRRAAPVSTAGGSCRTGCMYKQPNLAPPASSSPCEQSSGCTRQT